MFKFGLQYILNARHHPKPSSNHRNSPSIRIIGGGIEKIRSILGRTPNFTELSIFSVMWSEHCSYKNSIFWLKTLPKEGPHMLAEAGEENAGLVDIGNGLACAFKIESHNHPSAIEPYQGAATGVGGINRDIFTMGARPIAQLNSLRFGEIDLERTKWLMKGVVKGIGDYGNSFGIPVVGGEVYFDKCYNVNILVNAMSVGIVEAGKTISAISYGAGNPVYIVGADTGKDGIHGATFASGNIEEDSSEKLPAVQVGDPFQEKLLLEATLELNETDAVVGMQDMGAAGIICSTSEMSAKGKHGMKIDLDKVPTRQMNMEGWEILLSESQERMLVVVKKGREEEVEKIFEKWDIHCAQIGEVTEGDRLNFFMNGELLADVPADDLVLGGGAPVYEREYREPDYYRILQDYNGKIEEPKNLNEVARALLGNPNIASRKWVYEQYDSMVGTVNLGTNKQCDAGVVNIKGSNKALALSTDCNSRFVYADPEKGASMAVCEAARNIVCSGGQPSAITNCLNFGNPYNPEVYWQFVHAIKGMSKACSALKTPVTGGNVSFYNQTDVGDKEIPVYPTPVIGMLGLIEDKSHVTGIGFENEGDVIVSIGKIVDDINCSEYLHAYHGKENSVAPWFDLNEELKLQTAVTSAIRSGLIRSAHDVSEGGLFVSLAESAMVSGLGFEISTTDDMPKDSFLFGESQSRIIVSLASEKLDELLAHLDSHNVDHMKLGTVKGSSLIVDGDNMMNIAEAISIYTTSIEKHLAD